MHGTTRKEMKSIDKHWKYEDYQLEDFLADEFFVEWIKNPTDNNKHFWEKWLSEHPEKRKTILLAGDMIRRVSYQNAPELSDKSYLNIFEKVIRESPQVATRRSKPKKSFRRWLFSFRQIAALLILGLTGWLIFELSETKIEEEKPKEFVSEMVKRTAAQGTKLTFILEDGSKIFLNAGSELEFPKTFEEGVRKVKLKGEAFFEITEDTNRPFIVNTGQLEVKVLGTSFNVKDSEKGELSIALVSGKVEINDEKGNQLMLDPKEMMVFNAEGEFFKTGFDPLEITGWKDKKLVFSSDSIDEIENKIENWYGVQLDVKGTFPDNWAYSGVYNDEMLENVLRGISLSSSHIGFSLSGKKASITYQ